VCADTITLVLARWFAAHPAAFERDLLGCPVCPGPLAHTHCLWTYAASPRPRRTMTDGDGSQTQAFKDNSYMFGRTASAQNSAWREEQHAYYGLITPTSIVCTVPITRVYDTNSMQFTDSWLHTVTAL
jgi:hypothetical protein